MDFREHYEYWISNPVFDESTKSELKSISDEKEIEDRFYKDLSFGTGGMRGVLGAGRNRMNLYNVRRATKGVALWLKENPELAKRGVVIAYDSRRNSDLFAKQSALVLCENGIKAMLFDALRPVPVLSYAVRKMNAGAGIVITASHNPPQYNGYKLYGDDGAQIGPEVADKVTQKIRSLRYEDCLPMDESDAIKADLLQIIGKKEVDDSYTEMLHTLVVDKDILKKEGANFTIVYTPVHGSGNVPVRRILKEIGISNVYVVKEQENPDPNFSTVELPNPEVPSTFNLAIKLAKEVNADCAFATDPDCDRLGIAVKNHEDEFVLLNGNQIASIMLYYILSTKKKNGTLPKNGAVVKSIVSTELAKEIATSFGVETIDVLTGFKFVGEKIQEFEESGSHTFVFGFEESYGYLSGTAVRDKDAVNASMLISECACAYKAKGMTLYDALMDIYKKYGYYKDKVMSVTLPGKDGSEKMKVLMEKLHKNYPSQIAGLKVLAVRDYLSGNRTCIDSGESQEMGLPKSDVLYFELEDKNWVAIRPSGTEPKIKLYINANSKEEKNAEALVEKIADACQSMLK